MILARARRILKISRVAMRHDLDDFVKTLHIFRVYRICIRILPWRWVVKDKKSRAVRLREALEDLGPIFVKFGQMLSTRPDLLPADIASELTSLQDAVPPFSGKLAVEVIEKSFQNKIENIFSEFDIEPVASASVAQVHFAHLPNGDEVAVKVLRPGIEPIIERDLALLYTMARLAAKYWQHGKRLRPVEVIDEFALTIRNELDLMREGANASQLKANFEGSGLLYVPEIYWDFTRQNVLVMERIHGIPIGDIDALNAAGIDMGKLANDGVEIFFTQAFRDGFFHADMHPGNIFVTTDGEYRAIDFGIMGSLGEKDKRYLAENFLGFFNRDYRAVAEAHLRAGWVPADTKAEEFEAAIRAVCEPIFAKPIKDISFGKLLLRLFQTARQFQMEIQPQLVLLQKTMFQIEGLGRQLYPELDLWVTAKPFLEKWMREQLGPKALVQALKREMPRLWQQLPEMPRLIHDFLQHQGSDQNTRELALMQARLQQLQQRQRRQRNLFVVTGVGLISVAIAVIVINSQFTSFLPSLEQVPQFWQGLGWGIGAFGVLNLTFSAYLQITGEK
jgi:ubiquinone biosynthesis protein